MKSADERFFEPTRLTLASMLLASMLMLMGGAAVAPALPLIHEAFPDRDLAVSLIITVPSLAVGVTGFAIGGLADRFGKVRTLAASLIVFTAAGVSSYVLDDLNAILVLRFVLGIGIAGISAAVIALMAEYYAGAARTRVLGYQSAAMGVGVLVLEYAGGSLAAVSWQEPFLIYLIGIPIMLLCIASMREPREGHAPEERCASDGTPRKANTRLILVCYVAVFVCQSMSFLLPTRIPAFLEDPDLPGFVSASVVGLFLGIFGITNSVASLMYRRIASAVRPFFIMALGFFAMGVGLIVLIISPTVAAALAVMVLVVAGVGLLCPAISNVLAGEATSATSGKIMGGYSTFLNLGQFAISLISVPLLSMVGGSIPALFAVMGVVALAAGSMFVLHCARSGGFGCVSAGA